MSKKLVRDIVVTSRYDLLLTAVDPRDTTTIRRT